MCRSLTIENRKGAGSFYTMYEERARYNRHSSRPAMGPSVGIIAALWLLYHKLRCFSLVIYAVVEGFYIGAEGLQRVAFSLQVLDDVW